MIIYKSQKIKENKKIKIQKQYRKLCSKKVSSDRMLGVIPLNDSESHDIYVIGEVCVSELVFAVTLSFVLLAKGGGLALLIQGWVS